MSGAARLLQLWVRDSSTGIPLIYGALTVALSVALTIAFPQDSAGWSDALNAALVVVLYTGPLAFVGAALHTSAIGRRGLYALAATTPRGRYAPARLAAASSLAWALGALLLASVLMCVRQAPSGTLSWPPLTLSALAVALTTACSIVGSGLGARWHQPLVAPIGGFGVFVVLAVLTYLNSAHPTWSPIYTGVYFALNEQPNVDLVLGQTLVCCAVAVLGRSLIASLGATRGAHLVVAGLLAIAATVLLRGAGPSPVEFVEPTAPACGARPSVRLCLWPQYGDRLEAQLDLFARVNRELSPFLPVPSAYAQRGLSVPGTREMSLSTGSEDEAAELDRVVRAVVAGCPEANVDARDALRYWALARLDPDGELGFSSEQPEARIARLPTAQQRSWVSARVRERGC